MRKNFVFGLLSVVVAAFSTLTGYGQLTTLTEGFDTVGSAGPPATGIFAAGWLTINNSNPVGDTDWAQGIPPGNLDTLGASAQSGAPNSFIQTDFNAGIVGSGNIVSDWLITPVLLLENGATMSFYTQASPDNTQFPNELQVWESLSGSSTVNVGSTAADPGGDFTIKLLDINPGATVPSGESGGYPTTWTEYTFTISGLSASADGRFGFRFYLPNTDLDGTVVGIDTFSFADPTVFTRTVSGNWTDTTGWTPNGIPNGTTVTAQLVNPASGTNNVNLGGGTFTLNQLQFSGTSAGTWNVTNGTIIFDGTNPMFLNQGDSTVGTLPNLQLNVSTTFEIDNASAVTDVTGTISGVGELVKTGSGTLELTGTNTYTGGTLVDAGTLQLGDGTHPTSLAGTNGGSGGVAGADAVIVNNSATFNVMANATVTGGAGGTGGTGGTGGSAASFSAGGSLTNSGTISGGNGGGGGNATIANGGAGGSGGAAVSFSTDGSLTNSGAIFGGAGGKGGADAGLGGVGGAGGNGGAGVSFSGGGSLTNSGTISGGAGGPGGGYSFNSVKCVGGAGDNGGPGVSFSGGGSLTNSGTISGGAGGPGGGGGIGGGGGAGGNGGAGVSFSGGGSLTNSGTISGGAGGPGGVGSGAGGNGGAGVSFSGGGSLTNSGTISGGAGGPGGVGIFDGTGGFGVVFTGAAGTLTNQSGGVINGGVMMDDFANAVTLDTGSVINGILNIGTSPSATLTLDGTGTQLYSAAVTGATTFNGALVKNGTGTWTLDESFTYTGGTTINAGTLNVSADINLGAASGGLTFDGGTLQWGASFNLSATRAITLEAGNGTFDTNGFNTTIAQGITGSGGLTKAGSGTLTLSGANTYGGATTVDAGTLALGSGGSISSSSGLTLAASGAGFDISAGGNQTIQDLSGVAGSTINLGANTLTAGTANSTSFAGVISGTGALTKQGSGTLTLSGANTYRGATTVDAGTLALGSGGSIALSSGLTLAASGAGFDISAGGNQTIQDLSGVVGSTINLGANTLTAGTANSTSFAGVVSGTGALTKQGSGTLTLSGANTYRGATTVDAGTLALGSGGSIALSSGLALAASGAGFDISAGGNQTIQDLSGVVGSTINLGANTLTAGTANSTNFAGVISGTGALTKQGSGTLTLSGANTYGGATTVDAGTLALGSGGSISSSSGLTLAASGAGFDISAGGNQTIQDLSGVAGSTINLGANTLTAGTANSTSFAGVISGTGAITKQGSGTLTLSGANAYMGATTVNAGTLALGSGGSIASSSGLSLAASGAGFDISAGGNQTIQDLSGVVGSTINLGANTLTAGTANSTSFAGVISGTGALTKQGTGTLTLTGANTYSGGTSFNGATLAVNSDGNLGTGPLSFDGGTLEALVAGGGITSSKAITLNAEGGTFLADAGTSSTLSGVIGGSGSFTKNGPGTLALSGNNTYSGATTVASGTLQAGSSTAFSSNSAFIVTSLLDLHGFSNTIVSLSGNGTVTNNGAAPAVLTVANANTSTTFGGVLEDGTDPLGLMQTGTGTLILTGTDTYSGGTTISSGTLQLGNGGTSGSIQGNVTDNGVFAIDRPDTYTFAGTISGGGGFEQLGTGTTILTGSNTYTGGTTIIAGTLQLGNGTPSGSIQGNVTDNGVFAIDRPDTYTFAGTISGSGAFEQLGPGTAILTGTNTYSGGTMISAGTLQLGNGMASGSIQGDVTDNGVFAVDRSDTYTFAGNISGSGAFEQLDTGTTILTGTNTYTGSTTISAGTLQLGNGGTTGSILGNVVDSGVFAINRSNTYTFAGNISGAGALQQLGTGTTILTGTNTYTGGTTITAGTLQIGNGGTIGSIVGNVTDNGTLNFNRSDVITFGGVISGTGALVQSGSGTLALTANDTYSGGTTVDPGGILQIGNGGTTGSIIGNVTDNGSLAFDRSNSLTFNSVISGSGTVVQNGFGTIILGGTNTYTGGTDINNGTLLVNNAQALGLGNVVVNGGVLGADPQPINVKGNYTQNAGGTLELQIAGANPGQYDTLNVTRNASLGGTLQLSNLGFQPIGGDRLTLVSTGGVVTSKFGQFVDPFPSTGTTYNIVELVYGMDSVLLEFLTVPPPVPPPPVIVINFESFAQTPNEKAAGNLLDTIQLDPKAADLMAYLYKQPFLSLPGDLAQISPDALTSFYEITFSNANIQRLNIEGRLDDLRAGSTGFSSNMNVNPPPISPEGKGGVEGKAAKNPVEQALQPAPQNRWGIWVTGFGDFVNVDGDYNGHGYDFTTGGFTVGVDYRITDQFAIGAMGEYAHTWTSLKPSGDIDVDSGRGGVYATWFSHGVYLDGAIYGGHDVYSSSRTTLGGMANGGTGGAEYSAFMGGGYDFHCGHLTIGPTAALQYTYINIDSFDENGSLAPLNIHSQSAESLRTDFGARASYLWQVGKVLVEPSLRAAWEHEYKYSNLPIIAGFAGIPGPSDTFYGPSEGHDSAIISAGVSVKWTPMIATYVNYDGQLGRSRYDSNAVTGGVRMSF